MVSNFLRAPERRILARLQESSDKTAIKSIQCRISMSVKEFSFLKSLPTSNSHATITASAKLISAITLLLFLEKFHKIVSAVDRYGLVSEAKNTRDENK